MCGRYTLIKLAEFLGLIPWISPPDEMPPARYNIAPTQPVAVVPNTPHPKVDFYHWGLIPSWARDPSIGSRMINARAETLAEKPSFRTAVSRRRCLIPADGFYEWRKDPAGKTPMYVRLKSGQPFALAGLWDTWHSPDGSPLPSCTIITTRPNSLMEPIHDRMPVIIPQAAYECWLSPNEVKPASVEDLLAPYPPDEMIATVVGRLVNSPKNDLPKCIEAVES